ncbi:MAG: DEAD/DEAH box helicase family protein [Deltaproteobacteria bacterium]|nr:DEAD/DEAH box helicase family protein [Deltaproteobacteria bacterium]
MSETPKVTLRFDSGTLVLDGLNAECAPELVPPFTVFDERIKRYRAPGYRYREVLTHLVRRSRESQLTLVDEARKYDTLTVEHRTARTPFEHQREAIARWKANGHRGVVVLPTGSGKTFVAELAIALLQRSALIVAPTIDLMSQWYDVLHTAFATEIGLLGGGYHQILPITVSTYDSAYIHMDHYGARFGLVVFDEIHHLPSPTYLNAAESMIAPYRLGLTATPDRSDGREHLLDDRVGPVVFTRGIRDLAGSHLADYDVVTLSAKLTEEEAFRYQDNRETYRQFIRDSGIDMSKPDGWSRFIMMSSRSREGRRAFLAYREQRQAAITPASKLDVLEGLLRQHCNDRAIIFTNDNDTVYRIARDFLLPAITHQTDLKERKEILEAFNKGTYPAVVTSRVLNEGVNVPEASVAIVLSGTGSVREHVQRLGRILRRGENKRAILYEVITENTVEERTSDRRREHDAYRQ